MTDAILDPRVIRLTDRRRRDGARKEAACLAVMDQMQARGGHVTFADVQWAAGVSSWFTYNNATVRQPIESARATSVPSQRPTERAAPAGLRADLAHARHEVRQLREERDRLRDRVRRGLGAVVEHRDATALIERAVVAERQRDTLKIELHEAHVELAQARDDAQLIREELKAARATVEQMMRGPIAEIGPQSRSDARKGIPI